MVHQLKLVLLMLLFYTTASSQQISPQAINTAGKSSSAGGVILEDAVGGFIVATISTPTFIYTQDFLQPDKGTTTIVPPINNVVLSVGGSFGLDNAGTTFIAGNAMLEFTLGEVASITLNSAGNMLTQGILQPLSNGSVLSITSLAFYAKRLNNTEVQLDWKTMQESNNKGFHIERKNQDEKDFVAIDFSKSNAIRGNSTIPLQYNMLDNNGFSGITYYRLKQEDFDGKSIYSVIRSVSGNGEKMQQLTIWPMPAVYDFNVRVEGINKADVLQIFDINGRIVKTIPISNQQAVNVSGLLTGTYMIRLASDKSIGHKVIVQ